MGYGIQDILGIGRVLSLHWGRLAAGFRMLAAGMLFLLPTTCAYADGCMIGKGGDIREPEQKAVVLFADGVEDLLIQVQYDGAVDEFAWLVPVPARPEVSVVEADVFGELKQYVLERTRWKVYSPSYYRDFPSLGGGFGGRGGVTVHERRTVGVYDVAVLSSESVEALVGWCTQHGFRVPDEAPPVLKHYVDQGWVFTAMRIDPAARGAGSEASLQAGTIQAMRFTFPAREAVYPLRISSINRGATDVLVYVLAEDTLVSPAFVQRHAPSLLEFRLHTIEVAAEGINDLEKQFETFYDTARMAYRAVTPREFPVLHKALPRWGRAPLYLMPLQQTFEQEELVDDVVFRAPEAMSPEAQKQWVLTCFKNDSEDPMLLRIPDAAAELIGEDIRRYGTGEHKLSPRSSMRLLVLLEGEFAAAAIAKAAKHDESYIRETLIDNLDFTWFDEDRRRVAHDSIPEDARCERAHSGYAHAESSWYCHSRTVALPGVPAETLESALEMLFLSENADAEIAGKLAALGTERAISVLVSAACGELEAQSGAGIRYRRELALAALRHVRGPAMVGVYRRVLATSLDALSEREISCCLVGLWNNATPEIEMLVRQIELHCQRERMPAGAALARRLLVNRLGTQSPFIEEGMSLAKVEEELGGKGMIAKQLVAAGEEVVQYHWEAGDATVRSGVMVKWRPRRN